LSVRAVSGRGGQAALEVDCVHGRATVYLQGAHLTSWVPAGGDERLFVSEAARFAPGESIRGGIPVAFPQFAELGALPMHGFAHTLPWECVERSDAGIRLSLRDSEATHALWPHRFVAELEIGLAPSTLTVAFSVHNVDRSPLRWSGTLHTFLALDARRVRLRGLGPAPYLDRAAGSRLREDQAASLRIPGHTDRAYLDAGPRVEVDDGRRALVVGKAGFRDTVVWNPGPETTSRFHDLGRDDHAAFVCVEAAEVRPVTVAPGARWHGRQVLRRVAARTDPC
jgi:glucose-6-phosphate 1-epimerase